MDKVVHFEIPADDIGRAKQFYGSIFGWRMTDMPMPGGMTYTMIQTVETDATTHMPKESGAINGGMMVRSGGLKAPVFAINVSSVDEYIKKVEAAGGKIVTPKMEVGGMGYYAYVSDTEGNVIGLWEELKKS
jgi:predicted enzyme related to lactoylglutathione lyase